MKILQLKSGITKRELVRKFYRGHTDYVRSNIFAILIDGRTKKIKVVMMTQLKSGISRMELVRKLYDVMIIYGVFSLFQFMEKQKSFHLIAV